MKIVEEKELITISFSGTASKEFCKDREGSDKGVLIWLDSESADFQF